MKRREPGPPGWFTPMAILAALVGLVVWGLIIYALILAVKYLEVHT